MFSAVMVGGLGYSKYREGRFEYIGSPLSSPRSIRAENRRESRIATKMAIMMGHDEGQYQDLMMSGWWWWWWQILLSPDCKKPDRVLLFEGAVGFGKL